MRLAFVVVLLLSMASQCSAQRSDSTIARIERQGYSVSTDFGKAVPPFLAFKLTPTGGLTISAPMPIYYFDNRGQMLPGCPYEYVSLPLKWKNRAVVVRNGLMGMIDQQGRIVVPLLFQRLELADHPAGWLRAQLNGHWGLVDSTGNVQLEPKYDEIERFSDGFAAVKQDGKWGFLNLAGQMAIRPLYAYVREGFHEGFAAVYRSTQEGENMIGFIDKQNRPITAFKYTFPLCVNRNNAHFRDWTGYYEFKHGFALVRNDQCETGAIDTWGREVLPIRFNRVEITDSTVVGYRRKERLTYRIPR